MMTDSVFSISKLEDRIAILGTKIETTMHEDRILLLHVDHVATHCRRTLAWMDEKSTSTQNDDERSDADGTSLEEPTTFSSSATDTTGSERNMQPSASIAPALSQGSLSVIVARELFPVTSFSERPGMVASPESTSPSTRTEFVRKITYAREQQVRSIMANIKNRMKRRGSA